jgi:hypothetical protein
MIIFDYADAIYFDSLAAIDFHFRCRHSMPYAIIDFAIMLIAAADYFRLILMLPFSFSFILTPIISLFDIVFAIDDRFIDTLAMISFSLHYAAIDAADITLRCHITPPLRH